jgi:hypothetical protein
MGDPLNPFITNIDFTFGIDPTLDIDPTLVWDVEQARAELEEANLLYVQARTNDEYTAALSARANAENRIRNLQFDLRNLQTKSRW